MFDETTNSIVCRKYLVGGGKRLWQLWMKNFLDNDQICLFYAQKGSFYCDILKPLFLNFVKAIPHSENITALDFLIKDEKNFFILSGSLDRKIVCSNFNENQEFKINSSVQMHRSSVETICVLQENSNFLVLSGGGRSELFCWELIFEEQNLQPQFNLLFSTELKNENNIDDIRVLCVRWIFGRREFAVALCSDATIRILQLNYLTKSIVESSRFQLCSMAMFSSINLAGLIEESSQFLFSTTTSGYLFIFKLLILPNGTTKILIHEPYFVEKCGLSAISTEISPFNNHQHFILIGSESGSISILTFDSLLGNVENNIFVNLHASTITALKIWKSSIQDSTLLIASVALDCRLCIGNYIPDKNELIPQIQICLSISDPAALIVLPNRTRKELNEEE
uniref:Uncharacterized protein n=1 Tax=Meloidogyne enterolobii TaxID=390850 RepID=A0A6V7UQG3_MELEN|nr:unnamed protein product [Meloidogyne enterolobii]